MGGFRAGVIEYGATRSWDQVPKGRKLVAGGAAQRNHQNSIPNATSPRRGERNAQPSAAPFGAGSRVDAGFRRFRYTSPPANCWCPSGTSSLRIAVAPDSFTPIGAHRRKLNLVSPPPPAKNAGMMNRRQFLHTTAAFAAGTAAGLTAPPLDEFPPAQEFAGSPRERGLAYGREFKDGIGEFLAREIHGAFIGPKHTKDDVRRYAAACGREIAGFSPEIFSELEGIAEGAGIALEDAVMITLHEELYHRGVLPKVDHCTVVAAAPPVTRDGRAYLGQTWDWLESVYGTSRVLRWRRTAGPDVLAYGFPGLPVGAGLNAAGLALCWTSADLGDHALGARVGIPSYVLLTHLLYQKSLDDAAAEARRAKHAGWFTFVMADGEGRLLNLEGSPAELAVEWGKGRMVRSGFASEQMKRRKQGARTNKSQCDAADRWLDSITGKADAAALRAFFSERDNGVCAGKATIDVMLFDTTKREAHLSRGPHHKLAWKTFRFD